MEAQTNSKADRAKTVNADLVTRMFLSFTVCWRKTLYPDLDQSLNQILTWI
jgi:hypothetical protein